MNKYFKLIISIILLLGVISFFRKDLLLFITSIKYNEINYFLLIFAAINYILTFFLRSVRFSELLEIETYVTFKIYSISQFLSGLLPLKLGDLYLFKLKSKTISIKKIIKTYIILKILDLISVIIILFGIYLLILAIFPPYMVYIFILSVILIIPLIIFYLIRLLLKIYPKIKTYEWFITKFIQIKIIYKIWIITFINWIFASSYAIFLLISINKVLPYTPLQLLFANSSMTLGGMIPIPSVAGYGILEFLWVFGGKIVGISDINNSFSTAFFTHTFALILGTLLILILINMNKSKKIN